MCIDESLRTRWQAAEPGSLPAHLSGTARLPSPTCTKAPAAAIAPHVRLGKPDLLSLAARCAAGHSDRMVRTDGECRRARRRWGSTTLKQA